MPYRMLNIQPTMCVGGLFYSMSNITESCTGVLQSFIGALVSWDPDLFRASRQLLARMLIYVYQQCVLEFVDSDRQHMPDETMDGMIAILSLVNVAELSNVLHPDMYQGGVDPAERMFLIHVHKLGRLLFQWLENNYIFKSTATSVSTMGEMWQLYLFHQAGTLQEAKLTMEKAGIPSGILHLTCHTLSAQIKSCLGSQVNEIPESIKSFTWDKGSYQVSRHHKILCEYGKFTCQRLL
jgi:hypothetical protein